MRGQRERLGEAIQRLRQPRAERNAMAAELRVEVVSVEPFRVVATRYVGNPRELDQVYAGLFEWAAERSLLERLDGIFGVPHGDPRDVLPEQCAFDGGLAFSGEDVRVDGALQSLQLGGGTWARLRHVGSCDDLYEVTDRLIAGWLPDSGYMLRDELPFRHFLDDPEETPEAVLRADIYLPVAPG
jgi:AraC family transcriptional regulator